MTHRKSAHRGATWHHAMEYHKNELDPNEYVGSFNRWRACIRSADTIASRSRATRRVDVLPYVVDVLFGT